MNTRRGAGIPDWAALLTHVEAQSTNCESPLHGPAHWRRVAWAGAHLLAAVPAADPLVVLLFGLLHDTMRWHDGRDPDHGRRAAAFARRLQGTAYHLPPARLDTLAAACAGHADRQVTGDPTIGVCWDADRLNLWRVGTRPDPRWLSTAAAPGLIRWAADLQAQPITWDLVYTTFRPYLAAPHPPAPPI